MKGISQESLRILAAKYIWWKTPDEALLFPERIISQVMNIGDYSDVQFITSQISHEVFCEIVTHAEAGQFNERSWVYWHYRLNLSNINQVPELPIRRFV